MPFCTAYIQDLTYLKMDFEVFMRLIFTQFHDNKYYQKLPHFRSFDKVDGKKLLFVVKPVHSAYTCENSFSEYSLIESLSEFTFRMVSSKYKANTLLLWQELVIYHLFFVIITSKTIYPNWYFDRVFWQYYRYI